MRCVFVFLILCGFVHGQTVIDSVANGQYTMMKSAKIDSLIAKSIALRCAPPPPIPPEEFCKQNPKIWGYRIQVFHSQDRKAWEDLYAKMKEKYPQETVLQEYTYPYYRIFIGQYKDKASAQKDLKTYRRSYPSALASQWQVRCRDVMLAEQ